MQQLTADFTFISPISQLQLVGYMMASLVVIFIDIIITCTNVICYGTYVDRWITGTA